MSPVLQQHDELGLTGHSDVSVQGRNSGETGQAFPPKAAV